MSIAAVFSLVSLGAPAPLSGATAQFVISLSRSQELSVLEHALERADAEIVRQLRCTRGVVAELTPSGAAYISSLTELSIFPISDDHDFMRRESRRLKGPRGSGGSPGGRRPAGGKSDGGRSDGPRREGPLSGGRQDGNRPGGDGAGRRPPGGRRDRKPCDLESGSGDEEPGSGDEGSGESPCRPRRERGSGEGDGSCQEIDNYVLTTDDVAVVKAAIVSDIELDGDSFAGSKSDSIGELLRLVFHDAAPFFPDSSSGLNGCVDLALPANFGLHKAVYFLERLQQSLPFTISMADLTVLGAMAAIEAAGGPVIPFKFGRLDVLCFSEVDDVTFPDAEMATISELNASMAERFGLTARQVTALLGSHTVGRMERRFSSYEGGQVAADQRGTFDNAYFTGMFGVPWVKTTKQVGKHGRQLTVTEWKIPLNTSDSVMLNTDAVLGFHIDDGCNLFGEDPFGFLDSPNAAHVPEQIVECEKREDEYGQAAADFAASNDTWVAEYVTAFVHLVESTIVCGELSELAVPP